MWWSTRGKVVETRSLLTLPYLGDTMICRGRGSFASLFGHFCTQEGPLLGSMWYTKVLVSIKRMICRSKTYEEDPPLWSSPSICFIWPKSGVSGCIGQSKLLLCDQYALREAWEDLLCQLVSHLLFYCNIYRCQSSSTLHIELQYDNGSSKLFITAHAI